MDSFGVSLEVQFDKILSDLVSNKCPPLFIFVEGNIGAGKSYILDRLEAMGLDGVMIFKEPLERLNDVNGVDMLDVFSGDRCTYGAAFLLAVFTARVEQIRNVLFLDTPPVVCICERSIYSDRFFADIYHQMGYINDVEKAVYDMVWDTFESSICGLESGLCGVLFIETPVWECTNRLKRTNFVKGASVDVTRLDTLKRAHDGWIRDMSCPLGIVNGLKHWDGGEGDEVLSELILIIDRLCPKIAGALNYTPSFREE